MIVRDVIRVLNTIAPESAACDWDNVGLLCGSREWTVNRIYVALDATEDVILHAIDNDCDMLITHHPMIFHPMDRIDVETITGRKISRLLKNHIACYAMHTNFDIYQMSELANERLKLIETEALDICIDDKGIGYVGYLPESMLLKNLAAKVKEDFYLNQVKVFGNPGHRIKRVACVPGSGKSEIEKALEYDADVLITGDIDHHSGLDAVEAGLSIIDAGHYGIEQIFIAYMVKYLNEHLSVSGTVTLGEPLAEPFYYV